MTISPPASGQTLGGVNFRVPGDASIEPLRKRSMFKSIVAITSLVGMTLARSEDLGKSHPLPLSIPAGVVSRVTIFQAGEDGVHSCRIPAMVTANDGGLLVFAEARKESWRDKSPTDLVMKRGTDGGRIWSSMERLADGGKDACMDPVPLVDRTTGRVFVFFSRWPARDHSSFGNTAWMTVSSDHGRSWSKPRDVTATMLKPGRALQGFGPGRGLQMAAGTRYAHRLVVPVRSTVKGGPSIIHASFSDDGGRTWQTGGPAAGGVNECTIAESAPGKLVLNRRESAARYRSFSDDGGATWSPQELDSGLATVRNGCHGCLFGSRGVLLFTSPAGLPPASGFDNRANLTIHRSLDGGRTWPQRHVLNGKASGYSDLTLLSDGRLAVVLEAADTPGFTRAGNRDRWMRLDLMILPAEVFSPSHWFGPPVAGDHGGPRR